MKNENAYNNLSIIINSRISKVNNNFFIFRIAYTVSSSRGIANFVSPDAKKLDELVYSKIK